MSGHCPKCGAYHEEDVDRLCSGCLREAVRVLAEELIVARGYGLCIKGHETDRIAVTQRNTDANPIAKAALDAAGGA